MTKYLPLVSLGLFSLLFLGGTQLKANTANSLITSPQVPIVAFSLSGTSQNITVPNAACVQISCTSTAEFRTGYGAQTALATDTEILPTGSGSAAIKFCLSNYSVNSPGNPENNIAIIGSSGVCKISVLNSL